MELHYGNLIKMFEQNEIDVLMHGCNCFNTMGAGIAKHIRTRFPEAYNADLKTKKGDKSKLGNYSFATLEINGKTQVIVNAYTQFTYGREKDHFSYDTFPTLLIKINKEFAGKKLGLPLIGCGLAGGDEPRILEMIQSYLTDVDYKLVEIDTNRKLNLPTRKVVKP